MMTFNRLDPTCVIISLLRWKNKFHCCTENERYKVCYLKNNFRRRRRCESITWVLNSERFRDFVITTQVDITTFSVYPNSIRNRSNTKTKHLEYIDNKTNMREHVVISIFCSTSIILYLTQTLERMLEKSFLLFFFFQFPKHVSPLEFFPLLACASHIQEQTNSTLWKSDHECIFSSP